MQLKNHAVKDGKKVWLTSDELTRFLATADTTPQKIAFGLGARCGLRAAEIVAVTPPDIVESQAGTFVRVWDGKGSKYRETPIPLGLAATIDAYADTRQGNADVPLVDRSTRTIQRWVETAANTLHAEDNDEGWKNLIPHDLRRTWGTLLVEDDVEPGMVMEWGGWEDWETFREHYLGAYSMTKQQEERAKVSWL